MDEEGAKITELDPILGSEVSNADLLPIVDVSDTSMALTGTNKKLTIEELGKVTKTLTNTTLTSPVINTGVSGTAILDEDNMASDSATKLATQQSIKAYVDAGKVGASYNGFSGGDITTTSTSPVQVGSAQLSITTKGGNLFVSASALMKVNTLTGRLGIQIDGTTVVECITNSTSYVSLCPQYVKTSLSAGSHTIKLVFLVQSGSTATIPAYNTYFLSAVEL